MQTPPSEELFKAVACWVFGLFLIFVVPEIIVFLWVG